MNKIGCFVLTVVFVLSLFGALLCAANDIQAIGWKKTILTITFIGLPDGTVFGDYTDAAGRKHENEAALTMSGFLRGKDVEQYYGQEITILCGTEKGEVLDYTGLIKANIIAFCITLISGLLLYFGFIRKNVPQRDNR